MKWNRAESLRMKDSITEIVTQLFIYFEKIVIVLKLCQIKKLQENLAFLQFSLNIKSFSQIVFSVPLRRNLVLYSQCHDRLL